MNTAPMHFTPADAEFVEQFCTFQQSRALSVNTIARRRQTFVQFARHMAPAAITTATPRATSITSSRDCEHHAQSTRTKHAYRSDLGVLFTWLVDRGHLGVNPMRGTGTVRVPKGIPKPAPMESINAAFAMAPADTQLILMLGALAGLRIGEIAALHSDNVFLDVIPSMLIVRDGKGQKDRRVPLHPRLVEILRGQTGYLFPRRDGGHIRTRSAAKKIEREVDRIERAGFARFSAHSLRHAFGTAMARESGGDIILTGQLMGHASPTTTLGYIVPFLDHGADVVSRVGAGVQPAEPSEPVVDELAARRLRRPGA